MKFNDPCEKINEIAKILESKNIKSEIKKDQFGFTLSRGVWHWFEVGKSGHLFFQQSYNQNVGRAKKGLIHGLKIKERLKRYIGEEILFSEIETKI